jgi:hypothetical protein
MHLQKTLRNAQVDQLLVNFFFYKIGKPYKSFVFLYIFGGMMVCLGFLDFSRVGLGADWEGWRSERSYKFRKNHLPDY